MSNFPRITNEQQVDYRLLKELFPWGCSELNGNLSESIYKNNAFSYRYRFSHSPENIYKAIKYGVWTFPFAQTFLE